MSKLSKRVKDIKDSVEKDKLYSLQEAVDTIKSLSKVKFDETVELSLQLGVDPKYSDQMVRGVVSLPAGTGKTVKVAVFARGDKAEEAKNAGADIVGAEELVEAIQAGKIDFQKCIATPDTMALVGRVAKILGPKGLMPNPKLGSVTMNVANAVKEAKAGQVEFRVEKAGIVHAGVGKVSFNAEDLLKNITTLIDSISKAKPSGAKGAYMQKCYLSSTMGPGLRVDISNFI